MTINPHKDFLLQLLQKLGAPLTAAAGAHADTLDEQTQAATIATLLSESVKLGVSLANALNLKPEDGNADAIRVALSALAASLLADAYKQTGRFPAEADRARIQKCLESVIVFADNFAPAGEHVQRLKMLDGGPVFFDPVQTHLSAMHALLPAIAAIGEFSFGQEPARAAQDVADRLKARARALLAATGAEGGTVAELAALQALGQIYASAHRAQTARLKQTGDVGVSLDSVWDMFELQAQMLTSVALSLAGKSDGAVSAASGGFSPAPGADGQTPPASTPTPPSQQTGGNPMSFFKKK